MVRAGPYAGVLAAIAIGAGCVAPQEPGLARYGYASMATVDGAGIGGVVGLVGCTLFGGWDKAPTRLVGRCASAGALVGAPVALGLTLAAADEPTAEDWLWVSVGPGLLLTGAVLALLGAD